MTVWCRRVSVRIRLVCSSGSLSYSPCRSLSAHYWISGLYTLHIDTVRECLPLSIAPGNQAHAFNSAGFSWQLLQALQYLRVRRVGHRKYCILRILLCRGVL